MPTTRRKKIQHTPGPGPKYPKPDGFTVRHGDILTVKYDGANLQIAPFSGVNLDSAIYQRILQEGDDSGESFDQIYGYLRKKCLAVARRKLQDFAEELARAKERANGG